MRCGTRVNCHHVLFSVARLRELLQTDAACKRSGSAVLPHVILDITALKEGLVAALEHAFIVHFVLVRVLVKDAYHLDPALRDTLEALLRDLENVPSPLWQKAFPLHVQILLVCR